MWSGVQLSSSLRTRRSDIASTDVLFWWRFSLATPGHGENYNGESGQSRGWAPRGLRHRSDDVFSGSCMGAEPGLNLSGSQEPAKCQQKPSADTHLLHMSILPLNPSKGFPESSSPSGGPQLFDVLILRAFVALKSLPYSHVMSNVWSKCLKFYREHLM